MSLIEIRAPQSVAEYNIACAMVERVYREAGYLNEDAPFSQPSSPILAIRGEKVIGSISLSSGDDGILPTEEIFGFRAEAIHDTPRSQIFESQRLAVSDRSDSLAIKALIAAVIIHARDSQNAQSWIMTLKPSLARILWRCCYLKTEILPFRLNPETTPDHPGYWQTAPTPTAIRSTREHADAAIARLMVELEGKVEFNLSTFDHHLHYGCENTYSDRYLPAALAC